MLTTRTLLTAFGAAFFFFGTARRTLFLEVFFAMSSPFPNGAIATGVLADHRFNGGLLFERLNIVWVKCCVHFHFCALFRRQSSQFVMFLGLDLRFMKNKHSLLAGLKFRRFVPAHVRAGWKQHGHLPRIVAAFLSFIDLDDGFPPFWIVFTDGPASRGRVQGTHVFSLGRNSNGRDRAGHNQVRIIEILLQLPGLEMFSGVATTFQKGFMPLCDSFLSDRTHGNAVAKNPAVGMKNKFIARLYRFPTRKLDGDVLAFVMGKTLGRLEHLLNPDNRCAITDRNLFHGCRPDLFYRASKHERRRCCRQIVACLCCHITSSFLAKPDVYGSAMLAGAGCQPTESKRAAVQMSRSGHPGQYRKAVRKSSYMSPV